MLETLLFGTVFGIIVLAGMVLAVPPLAYSLETGRLSVVWQLPPASWIVRWFDYWVEKGIQNQ